MNIEQVKENTGPRTIETTRIFCFVSDLIKNGRAEGYLFVFGEDK